MEPRDAIERLEHDHADISRRVARVREALASPDPTASVPAELARELVALTDTLFEHFAREEEGLFPFAVANVPSLAGEVERLVRAHDRICGAAARLLAIEQRGAREGAASPSVDLARALFARFEDEYGEHAGRETEFLKVIAEKLDARARAELDEILRTL